MQETLHDHHTFISIGGRPICDQRFADDIDLIGSSNGERQDLTNRPVDRAAAYGMEVSTEKNKFTTNSTNNICAGIGMNGQKLEEVTSFKNMGAILRKDGFCSAQVRIRIAPAMAAVAKLNKVWRCNTISFKSKFKLYKSLVISILLYGCEICERKKDRCFRNQVPEETSPHLLREAQDQRLGAEQDQLPCGSTGTSSDNCQETETCMVRACYTPRQPLSKKKKKKTSLRAPWRMGDAVVGRINAGRITSKSGHPCSQEPLTKDWKMISDESSLCPPDDLIDQGTALTCRLSDPLT